MKYLLYAILRESATWPVPLPAGLDGEPVRLIAAHGLVAACSGLTDSPAGTDVPCLLAYARTIEQLARRGDALPMRFGCLLESEDQVLVLLCRRQADFRTALDTVGGCAEMGIRLLLPDADIPFVRTEPLAAPRPGGASYLADRRALYARKDGQRTAADRTSAALRLGLEGLFVQWRSEESALPEGRILSLHFLVRSSYVPQFRQAYHRLQEARCDRALLTGPWPPYNFVQVDLVGEAP